MNLLPEEEKRRKSDLPEMATSIQRKVRRTGFILCVTCLAGSVVAFTQITPGSPGRMAMILTGITAFLVGLSLFFQSMEKEP